MTDKLQIAISSPPDRRHLVAELFFDNVQWAEISREEEEFKVEFYARPDGVPWALSLADVFSALNDARNRLQKHDQDSNNL